MSLVTPAQQKQVKVEITEAGARHFGQLHKLHGKFFQLSVDLLHSAHEMQAALDPANANSTEIPAIRNRFARATARLTAFVFPNGATFSTPIEPLKEIVFPICADCGKLKTPKHECQ